MIAFIPLTERRVVPGSIIEIRDGGTLVDRGRVPEIGYNGYRTGPHRVWGGLTALGFKPVDYYNQRDVDGGVEIDVEPLT